MPPKRPTAKASEQPLVLGGTAEVPPIPEKFADIAAALQSAPSLPEACRMMLVAGLECSLGVEPAKRDAGQSTIVRFIGEVLEQRDAELATRAECHEADVVCARAAAEEHAEMVRKAEEVVAYELSFVNAKRAIFDEDDTLVKEAKGLADAAESARSATEANLLAWALEKEDCQVGRKLVNEGACSDDIKTEKLSKSISMIQHLATKLGLEQSLVLTLQFMAKKPMHEWSSFEQAAARMIDESLSKHLIELEQKMEEGTSAMATHVAASEVAMKKLDVVKEKASVSESSLREAESKHQAVLETCTDAQTISQQSAGELERAQSEWSAAKQELATFREGPMEIFQTHASSPAADCNVQVEVVAEDELEEEPSKKRLRLSGSLELTSETEACSLGA